MVDLHMLSSTGTQVGDARYFSRCHAKHAFVWKILQMPVDMLTEEHVVVRRTWRCGRRFVTDEVGAHFAATAARAIHDELPHVYFALRFQEVVNPSQMKSPN